MGDSVEMSLENMEDDWLAKKYILTIKKKFYYFNWDRKSVV